MDFPKKREDFSVEWFNSAFNAGGITVHDFTFAGNIGKGRGFMGTLEQVELKISKLSSGSNSTETLYVILKTLPEDTSLKKFAANSGFSSREICVYREVFTKWDLFMDDRQVPSTSRFRHPICYYGAEDGNGDNYNYLLVIENLTTPQTDLTQWNPGFTEPLPWKAASAAIQQIARFHATGIAYKKENHIECYYEQFPKLYHAVDSTFKSMWDNGFNIAKEAIAATVNENDIPDGLYKRLDELKSDVSRNLVTKWFSQDPKMISAFGDTATICHHDLHSQNLVLSKDYSNAVLFDFQVVI